MKLTREEALGLHRNMWESMRNKYGDNATVEERAGHKYRFTKEITDEPIDHFCFLCEYSKGAAEKLLCGNLSREDYCEFCPIDWRTEEERDEKSDKYIKPGLPFVCQANEKSGVEKIDWRDSPISEILALPERKLE